VSQRTKELEELSGIQHFIRELRYHEFSRQGIGVILVVVFAVLSQPTLYFFILGCLLVLDGLLIRLYASGFVYKNKELSTSGPYAYVRHPLYTGNILILIGISFAAGSISALVISIIFFWFYYPAAIEYEDRKLKLLFPDSWDSWSQQTPALMPKFKFNRLNLAEWSWEKSLKKNYEPVIFAFVLFWLIFLANRL
jgi:isoprenylcysteine carboxyl methyltransferase (ICMT) family protein YpbQ